MRLVAMEDDAACQVIALFGQLLQPGLLFPTQLASACLLVPECHYLGVDLLESVFHNISP